MFPYRKTSRLVAILTLILTVAAVSPVEARRGGSFGSRGTRTYSAPRATAVTPGYVAPVQRSMTAPPASRTASSAAPPVVGAPPRMGFGGGLIGGLVAGGLIGGLMGHGWGGGGGGWGGGYGGNGLASIIQLLILGFAIWWIVGLFRRRATPAAAQDISSGGPTLFGNFGGAQSVSEPQSMPIEFAVTPSDLTEFGQLLVTVQEAFGHEDFGRLRSVTTPEVMSYLAEELSENSVKGARNDVTGTRLLNSEISEAWREGSSDYVTAALHYESVDIMRNRATGEVISGDPNHATETREVWTFVRQPGTPWKLSAIQSA